MEHFTFFTNSKLTMLLWTDKNNEPNKLFEIEDDHKLTKILHWDIPADRSEIQKYCKSFETKGSEWRSLKHDGNDKQLIRWAISALNHNQEADATIPEVIAQTRHIWEKHPNELIPTPIPHHLRNHLLKV